ncbi:MAG: DUF4388 domain-containing protein [Kofleriaceae bacterium]|nr:DUF4388 domain-containing protein [Kofleriaceae bacterium]
MADMIAEDPGRRTRRPPPGLPWEAVLRGSFATMSVVDLLEWIERRRVSGRLVIDGEAVTRTFTLDTGAVVWASSSEPTEQLGQILRAAGQIDDQALAVSLADGARGPLGARLVEHGAVEPEVLRAALLTKIREALGDVLAWRDGLFDLEAGPAPPAEGVRAVVTIADVLALAARRARRWPAIRALIPDDETAFRRVDAVALRPAPTPAAIDDARLLAAVERGATVRPIIAALGGERFAVLDRLAELVADGALELCAESEVEQTPAELVAQAERLAQDGDWERALDRAARAFTTAPDHQAVAAAYRRIERARIALLARTLLIGPGGRARIPVLRRGGAELAQLELAELERRLAHAVDGRWDLLTLVQHAPVRPAEALVVFARLVDRGIVELT